MLNLPDEFTHKYRQLLGNTEAEKMFAAMSRQQKRAFRINSLKFLPRISYDVSHPVPGIPNAYYGQAAGLDPEWVSGSVYSQDPSAMFPAEIVGVQPGERVLDLCAAPGGKSTALGEKLQNSGLLVANEISHSRAKILRENIERWGITNALITSEKPEDLVKHFPHFFDLILVDAPCSGEGMFRKNPEAIDYWSPDYVLTCQKRQKEILLQAVKMLRPGGSLIYSTCTYAPEEDEEIVAWLVKTLGMKVLPIAEKYAVQARPGRPEWADNFQEVKKSLRFWPQDNLGEGQFVAKLQLPVAAQEISSKKVKKRQKEQATKLTKDEQIMLAAVLDQFVLPDSLKNWRQHALVRAGHVFIPAVTGAQLVGLKILNNGVELGQLKTKRFVPSHQLAMVLSQEKQEYKIDLAANTEYRAFLHGETIAVTSHLTGFVLVSYHNFTFSFGKIVNGRTLKNFYPKGLRTLKRG
ncbi:RsmB/NOP family class I SAM-dependent RNA methyltransferase [Lactobacillus sp. ESL0791]|uniref:RsmB/NOP family class I SAM-dependent RNA methyltransferase n=1 Tax=Lactobacillus sp. ESL0791 TaxID=2983234 RepID=UPI0023F77C17|nr:RsmB/NOP family class I SAM-dependent RNA methyltransferase [Lactobacillus sp. ESL0791]MDF7638938.1 RsmB/NOP family class I SAM-dependent RNA methyltransferase [Lactobacillus sp. ESL0791]